MHVTRTPALGRRFLVKSQMPNMPWALEYFFSRSNTGYYCVGWKGVRSTYDGRTSPVSSQENQDLFNIERERERVVTERVELG
jgi:hypothetical protein